MTKFTFMFKLIHPEGTKSAALDTISHEPPCISNLSVRACIIAPMAAHLTDQARKVEIIVTLLEW